MTRKKLQNLSLNFIKDTAHKTFKHEGFVAGVAPNLRGPYATMYVKTLDY